jgi:lipoprotein-anchoring transpeptidase ErfK/SrfK
MRLSRTLPAVALLALALSACGGSSDHVAASSEAAGHSAATTAVTNDGNTDTTVASTSASDMESVSNVVAQAKSDLPIYAAVGDTTAASTLSAKTTFGSPTTVRVIGENADVSWLLVQLPVRPNGSTGYVRASDVTLATVDVAVDVDLAARHLQVVRFDGTVVLASDVAVGSDENPTPTGDFFVTDVIDTGNASGSYGPYALGLSAHSDTLSEFGGGDGQIGLHGTNSPSSIGNAVSHGCVRLPNDVIVQLAQMLPLGAPVTIH